MDTDDIAPPPRSGDPVATLGKQDLDPFSVAELDARVAALEAEIERVKAHKARAINHRAIADTLFKR